jgi:hypothetical protein
MPGRDRRPRGACVVTKLVVCLEFNVPQGDHAAEFTRQALEGIRGAVQPNPIDVLTFLGEAAETVLGFLWEEVDA